MTLTFFFFGIVYVLLVFVLENVRYFLILHRIETDVFVLVFLDFRVFFDFGIFFCGFIFQLCKLIFYRLENVVLVLDFSLAFFHFFDVSVCLVEFVLS